MKKQILNIVLSLLFIAGCTSSIQAATTITAKEPYLSPKMRPIVAIYKRGDYTGTVSEINNLLKTEPLNTYAYYYKALAYTNLGMKDKAEASYRAVLELNSNAALSYYSRKALACLADPSGEACVAFDNAKNIKKPDVDLSMPDDDITKFIKSGKMIHPAAADAITKERMERKIQEDEYLRKQREMNADEDLSALPTKEEVANAYDVLRRAGLNAQNGLQYNPQYSLAFNDPQILNAILLNGNNPDAYSSLLNNSMPNNNEVARMMLLNQMTRNQSALLNHGI